MSATSANRVRTLSRRIHTLDLDRLSPIALAFMLLLAGGFLFRITGGTEIWADEWTWVLDRRGSDLASLLAPHNGHLSLVPVAIYKVLLATAGIDAYAPYRALVILAHLGIAALVFVYVRRRLGPVLALVGAGLVLFFGPGWQNVLWPFQIAWLIGIACGVAAFLLLERGDRRGDVGASILLGVALASSALGLPIALGLAVDVGLARRRLRDGWIVAAPLGLYALWWLAYQDQRYTTEVLPAVNFVMNSAAATLSALLGLGGELDPISQPEGTLLVWGPPLFVAAVAVAIWRLRRLGAVPPRLLALLTVAVAFWTLTALTRSGVSEPTTSRYLYVGAVFTVLATAELARGLRVPARGVIALCVIGALAAFSNVAVFRNGAAFLRSEGARTRAELAALDIVRPLVPARFVPTRLPLYPYVFVPAGAYFAASAAVGSPAATAAEIPSIPAPIRRAMDFELRRAHAVAVVPAAGDVRLGDPPAVELVEGGRAAASGSCVEVRPAAFGPDGDGANLHLVLPAGGLRVTGPEAPVRVNLRRFAPDYVPEPLGELRAASGGILRIRPDLSPEPWRVRLTSERPFTACGLG